MSDPLPRRPAAPPRAAGRGTRRSPAQASYFAAAVWAARQSGSFALSLWCFFLVQALYAAIPARFPGEGGSTADAVPEDRFQRAHRAAEAALRSLHSIR